MRGGDNDGDQTAGLDQREQAGEQDRFQNAPGGDRAEHGHNNDHDDAWRQADELPDVAGRAERDGRRRHDADRDRQQAGQRGGSASGTPRAHRRLPGTDRKAGGKLGVGADRERHRGRG